MTLTPDTLFVNGLIYTVDDAFSTAEAVAVRGAEIVFVGSTDGATRLAGEDTRIVDLEGRTVVPGFTDSHLHPVNAAKNLEVAVQLTGSRSLAEALRRRADPPAANAPPPLR